MMHPLPTLLRQIGALCLFTAALILSACRTPQPAAAQNPAQPVPEPLYEWRGDEIQGKVRLKISLQEQKAHIFKNDQDVGWTRVATGLSTHPTPRGEFTIMEKQKEKFSSKYGVIVNSEGNVIDGDAAVGREKIPDGCRFVAAPMPFWMRLTGFGVGMHAGSIPHPGYPASHGCIRLPEYMARKLFENAPVGTPVIISN
jgi:lipoprotein-anchoring transpeptidase ErfK/SrfK